MLTSMRERRHSSVGIAVPASSFSQQQMLSFVLERFNIRESDAATLIVKF